MNRSEMIRSIAPRILLIFLFVLIFGAIIGYSRGYRINLEDTKGQFSGISSTGIISVSASPKAAKVFVNGKLKGVTDLNITLPPGEYTIDVKKEGYTDWSKKVKIKGEIVLTLDVLLFPKNPSLQSLSNLGIVKAVPYHEGNKLILFSQSEDIEKDGIYVFDANNKPLSFFTPLKILILKKYLPADVNLADASIHFSPDLQQAIFDFPSSTGEVYSYLFTLGEEVNQPFDISSTKDTILESWTVSKNKEVNKILETYPKSLRPIATTNFSIISFSPDQTKMLYQSKTDIELPLIINPPLIGSNQTTEERSLKKDQHYIYDKKEDKNYPISFNNTVVKEPSPSPDSITRYQLRVTPTPTPTGTDVLSEKIYPIVWHADSKHISIQQEREIVAVDFDGTNKRTIYSGPFEQDFFFISNNGKLYILTNLNPQNNKFADLYEIGIQ